MIFFSIKMQSKYILLFVLIASIKLVYSVSILGGGNSGDRSRVNEDGIAHFLDKPLDRAICGLGLACPEPTGPLNSLNDSVGPVVKGLGIGIDGDEGNVFPNGGGNGGNSGCKNCGGNGNGNNGNGNNGWNNGNNGWNNGNNGWDNGNNGVGQGNGCQGNGNNGGGGSNCGCPQ